MFLPSSVLRIISRSPTTALAPVALSHTRAYAAYPASGPSKSQKDSISQGNAVDPSNVHKKDVQSQSVKGGQGTRKDDSGGPVDAASAGKKKKPSQTGKGNPEGVGMVDQVGSASGSAEQFEKKK